MSTFRRPACTAAVVVLSTVGALNAATAAPAPSTSNPTVTRSVGVVDDAYVGAQGPVRSTGSSDKLVSSTSRDGVKTSYLKFAVPAVPAGSELVSAKLVAQAARSTAPVVQLRPVSSTTWSEKTLAFASRPKVGAVHAAAEVAGSDSKVAFDVTALVRGRTVRSFALTSPQGINVFHSKEAGTGGARLFVTYRKIEVTPPPPTDPPKPAVPATRTQFGMSIAPEDGENAADAVRRLRTQFGALPVARVFSAGLMPTTWQDHSTLRALGSESSVVYSFKADMQAVAAGTYDERLKSFLASRPAGMKVWVALHHEPEDDVERGAFTAAQFRAATAHVAPIIRQAGAVPTTILMQYTLSKASGRDWHDYYSPAIDVMAFDAYNTKATDAVPTYKSAAEYVAPVQAMAKETGKAFGWAELGSPCIKNDTNCLGRAAWLTSLVNGFSGAGAQFATYWNRPDFGDGFDYSLDDAPSVSAWRVGTTR